ncbi:hypothetical protein V9T40_010839 [Parthenolecanium corni]|uniref:BTB domain-containing protein n=1 Tax=Parthenolecanium corni TaxID=536013 RepID=A0AAN9T852_9HEMI
MERAELLPSSFAKLLVLYPREVFGFRFVECERERETMVTRDRKRSTKLVPNRRPHLGGPTSTKERIFFSRCNFRRKNNERVASQKEMLGDRSEIERMSSSSTYPSTPYIIINMLLREHYDKFPILILKDIKYQELQAMMNYMYRGEVNITQETLGSFLKAAESLQIRGLTDNSNNNCVENNNGIVRDGATHPYHSSNSMSKKLIPDSRKLVVPPHTPPLLSQQPLQSQSSPLQQQPPPPQQRSRSPQAATLLSQQHHKKYLKSPAILENHHNPNATSKSSASSEPSSLDLNCSSSSTKRRKLLPPIKSESLVVTPINPAAVAAAAAAAAAAASTYNNLDVNSSLCNNEVPSQQQQLQPPSSLAPEGKAIMVSSPSGPPKVESPHMDISPVAAPPNKISSATGVCAEPLIKPKPLAELVKVKSEQLDDSFNEDTNDDSQNTEDNCDIDRDDNSQLGGTMPFSNSQSGQNFENLERSLVSQDGSLPDAATMCRYAKLSSVVELADESEPKFAKIQQAIHKITTIRERDY